MAKMQWVRRRLGAIASIVLAGFLPACPQMASASPVITKWNASAIIKLALTPNYSSGFGAVKAVFGTQPAPVHGADAALMSGAVDFGNVLAGDSYLYKFAAHLNVTSNDANGFYLYGEGAADFVNQNDMTSQPLQQTLFYLNSASGGADPNNGFSPGLPFYRTSGAVSGGGSFNPPGPSITYGSFPSPIATSALANNDFYYDYQLKVPATATAGFYYVWIVYTVVPK